MEEVENENEHKRSMNRSPSPGIKSTAVVKYTAFQTPATYAQLQCNTDLNLPPSNYGAAMDSYGLKQILTRGPGMSSFRMAHMFPDCVGEVDVIAGAEVIKKLLKLPYQPKGTVSMMVHRVENTLLLDDFDVYDYLMKSEWSWLKDFFYENILKTMSEQERMKLTLAPPSADADGSESALQLTNKFLSHSLAQPAPPRPPARGDHARTITEPFLPEPEARPGETPYEQDYNRNVHWTFEDIHMLIGSDLPIFGDEGRPCVSLRLRDAREPINVLTGIDYWLDNLMCNVPEVLMCYHLDGIVQKYEPMKTEDLPTIENSKFSPKVIRNVAQNILSFLKSNATKAGHTYWLFKGPHDDVVKLYDLTSLCPDDMDNPFTTPVAMLLYRVARNMRMTNRSRSVRRLLEQVVSLLRARRHAHIAASARYMLADLCLPADTDPAQPVFTEDSSDSEGEDTEYEGDFEQDNPVFTKEQDSDNATETSERDDNTQTNVEHPPSEEIIVETQKENTESAETGKEQLDKAEREDIVESEKDDKEQSEKTDREVDIGNEKERSDRREREGDSDKGEEKGESKDIVKTGNALAVQTQGLALRNIGDPIRDNGEGRKSKPAQTKSLGTSPPDRCGKALQHALKGLLALHDVTIDKCKEEERERLRQQIIKEEQHPKMANPYEPIKMDYEPLKKEKELGSRSRRRKRDRKQSSQSENYLIESNSNVDKNAISILKEKNVFPTWQEPNRDDNFAWKLHLKTLLYEKICLAYATLAEYSYANEQYGFSLKYIDMAAKCQKLLSHMIIKSKVVDVSCLIGRVGDNYFQMSKHWARLEQFRTQFETDHDVDAKIRRELDRDMEEEVDGRVSNEFDLDIALPRNQTEAMLSSRSAYRRGAGALERRDELRRRMASVNNELAVRYMNDAQQIYLKYTEESDQKATKAKLYLKQFNQLSKKSLECLDEATQIFQDVSDQPNLALLYCNKGRYMRFKAHCDQTPGFNSEKRSLYSQAEDLYRQALKTLGPKETCGAASIWELVSWELSCHLYTRAVLMQDDPGTYALEVSEVADALRHALKHCLLSPGPREYLYQFRAAMIYHRLGSLYHSQYRLTNEEGPKRRTLFNATQTNYGRAANMFAGLEDAAMFLTVRCEHVALLEAQAQVSPNLKLKSLQNAVQLLRQSQSIMKLLSEKDPDEKDAQKPDPDDRTMKSEHSLLNLFENRLHFILKSIIQHCRSKGMKDYDKVIELYKKLYCASLKIKKTDSLKEYATSIYEALIAMDEISKQCDEQ